MLRAHSRQVPTGSDVFRCVLIGCESQKTHFFCCFGAPKPPKLVQNLSEPVRTRRIPSGMDPKHSQPLAASEKQEWLEFWQAQRFCRNYKKPVVQQLELGWAAGLVGLGWAGLGWAGLGWAGLGWLLSFSAKAGCLLGWAAGLGAGAFPVFLEQLRSGNA